MIQIGPGGGHFPQRIVEFLLDDFEQLVELRQLPNPIVFSDLNTALAELAADEKTLKHLQDLAAQLENAFGHRLFSFARTPINRLRKAVDEAVREKWFRNNNWRRE